MDPERRERALNRQVGGVRAIVVFSVLIASAWFFDTGDAYVRLATIILGVLFLLLMALFADQIADVLRPALRKMDARLGAKLNPPVSPDDQWLTETAEDPDKKS